MNNNTNSTSNLNTQGKPNTSSAYSEIDIE